jgi:hypothetical protein
MTRRKIDHLSLSRRKSFIPKVLSDFAFQWRHVLHGHYNNSTFRRLAYAIMRIVALDFNVKEITHPRQGLGGFLVWVDDLPNWDLPSSHIYRFGDTSVVICQHAPHAISMIRNDFLKRAGLTTEPFRETLTYLILSVREVVLFRINKEVERHTKPHRLFNGQDPPSDEAIDLLQSVQQSPKLSPLRKLPVELQDSILDEVSAGPIERARIGCLLDAGSNFGWACGNRIVEREEGRRNRTSQTPVESHVQFDGCDSGVAYREKLPLLPSSSVT